MRLLLLIILFPLLFLVIPIIPANAQSTISGDRPGFGVSSATLPTGHGQVETGFQYTKTSVFSHWWGPLAYFNEDNFTTFRFGVTDWLEIKTDLNIGKDYGGLFPDVKDYYFSAPTIGTRVQLFQTEKAGSGLFYGTVSLPFLASDPQPVTPYGDFRFLYTLPLCSKWTLDVNVGTITDLNFRSENSTTLGQIAVAGTWAVCTGWSLFGEYYATTDFQTTEGWADGGVIFNPSQRTQIDLSGGFLLHQPKVAGYRTGVWFLTAGFGWRFPS